MAKNELKFTGAVSKITPLKTGTKANGGTWQSRSVQLTETEGTYPQSAMFGAFGDKCDLIGTLRVGEVITVHFNLKSRDYNGNTYTDLQIWKVERIQGAMPQPQYQQAQAPIVAELEETDDLPF